MTADSLRRWCLARPSAVEEFPFGPETSVFKVGGKIFAPSALDARPLTVSLKCEPSLAEALRAEHSAIRPGYHLNKRHWITVTLDDSLPRDWCSSSWRTATSWSSTGCRSPTLTHSDAAAAASAQDQSPNQRARLVAPNSSFSAAYSRDGSNRWAAAAGPLRKLTSTLLTSPSPNSA